MNALALLREAIPSFRGKADGGATSSSGGLLARLSPQAIERLRTMDAPERDGNPIANLGGCFTSRTHAQGVA